MSTYEPESTNEAWHLLRKIFLLLLVVTASALGLVLLSRQRNNVPPVLFNLLADASLGLLVGLAARFVLRDRHTFIQGLASAAVSLIGLALLGILTGWKNGIGPFQADLVRVHWLDGFHIALRLPLGFGRSGMDIMDLVHAAIAMDTSWIALRVWKPSPRLVGQDYSSPAPQLRRPVRPRATQSSAASVAPMPASRVPTRSSTTPLIRRRKTGRPLISKPAIRPMRAKPRRASVRTGQSAVHLAVHEEHRCPYCLEPVKRNDSRGTVECQVCHTLHHKDCWDITGSCQVPHLNT